MPAAIVTGASGGLGYETSVGLARAGVPVVMTGRNQGRGEAALARLQRAVPGADARFELLDVADLAAIAAFAARWQDPVRVLVNNAAVMAFPERRLTVDGFEAQIGTNYLGHFALTLRLLPHLIKGRGRVVSLSSVAHRRGKIAFDDFSAERRYSPWGAYAQSKLAMLMFARELQRRVAEHGWPIESIAAHPGWSATKILVNGRGDNIVGRVGQALFSSLAQSAAAGAQPILFAALDKSAQPGAYYGPRNLGETRGPPGPSRVAPQALDQRAAARLWDLSEQMTGITLATAAT